MDGTVSSYLASKGYGFIRGDDGRDYFLHAADFAGDCAPIEGQRLAFEETATPRGYRARKARALGQAGPVRYLVPESIMHSRGSDIPGWETLQASQWTVHGSSRESPDDAQDELLGRASSLGANGVVLLAYYKTTGSEAGTGRGVHRFTIHNFKAHPVMIGRASTQGSVSKASLSTLDILARELKTRLEARTRQSTMIGLAVAAAIFLSCVVVDIALLGGGLIGLGAGALLGWMAFDAIRRDHDSWLQAPFS